MKISSILNIFLELIIDISVYRKGGNHNLSVNKALRPCCIVCSQFCTHTHAHTQTVSLLLPPTHTNTQAYTRASIPT